MKRTHLLPPTEPKSNTSFREGDYLITTDGGIKKTMEGFLKAPVSIVFHAKVVSDIAV